MREVAVIGVGMTKFGELWNTNLRSLFVEAALKALKDAGVDRLDSMYVGCMTSGLFAHQEHLGALMADYLGQKHLPAYRIESACASGGLAFRLGFIEVASGMSDIVLVGGVEKMHTGADVTDALSTASDSEYEAFLGITFPGLYAMIANAYMHKYRIPYKEFREKLAHVAVKNHEHGSKNPNAQFRMKITVDTVLNSTLVADPLRLMDCSPVTDGAACVVLAPVEIAKKLGKPVVKVIGSGAATSAIALAQRDDIAWLDVVEAAAKRAYDMAKITPKDIDLVELHDCFTIAEVCVLEALGFYEPGGAINAAYNGDTYIGGKLPVNTSGGLKAKGHPVGATGVAQIVEIVEQLRGNAGERQVKGAKRGLAQNMGGSGASSVVHILEVE
ncbi:MAG: thiolase domain-containing protein [Thermosulfidibacteraceae bacterium]|jgi:acetyl-CoA C-acetyltransferase